MVTDTNHHVRDLLKRELEKDGYSVFCVRSGIDAYHSICDSGMVDLVILDPELLYPYGHSLFADVLDNNPSLQIIIHTYHEFTSGLKTGTNVHIVEKNATSVRTLKEKIRACSLQKASCRKSQPTPYFLEKLIPLLFSTIASCIVLFAPQPLSAPRSKDVSIVTRKATWSLDIQATAVVQFKSAYKFAEIECILCTLTKTDGA